MRSFFFRRNWRERILLLLVLLVGVSIWLGSSLRRLRTERQQNENTNLELATQANWITQKEAIEERLKNSLDQVRAGRSLTLDQFRERLNQLLLKHIGVGERFRIQAGNTPADRRPPVAVHTLRANLDKVSLGELLALIDDLAKELPLVNIDTISIVPDTKDPQTKLAIDLKLSALELLK